MKSLLLKPYWLFSGVAVLAFITALYYYYVYPETFFDFGTHREYYIGMHYVWLIFAIYVLGLAAIYYTATKGRLRTRRWLIGTHFAFIVLFLFLFLLLSTFNTPFIQDRISGFPLLTIIGIYAVIFLLDLISLVIGLVLLLANILLFKRN
jgi:hypothetical protein